MLILNPYKRLPTELRIRRAGDRLYDKKLTPIQTSYHESNRHKLLRLLKCIIMSINLARYTSVLYFYITKYNEDIDARLASLYLGDFCYYLPSGMKNLFNIKFEYKFLQLGFIGRSWS
jgi:hypothetical protein